MTDLTVITHDVNDLRDNEFGFASVSRPCMVDTLRYEVVANLMAIVVRHHFRPIPGPCMGNSELIGRECTVGLWDVAKRAEPARQRTAKQKIHYRFHARHVFRCDTAA